MKLERTQTRIHPLQNEQHNRHLTSVRDNAKDENETVALQDEKTVNSDEIKTVVSKMNEFAEPIRTNLKFEFHDELDDYFVKVINSDTDEVIREIPPEEMLDRYAAMAEFMGVLVDEKV